MPWDLERTLSEIRGLATVRVERTSWIALTGSPSAGKSTLLEDLKFRGYATRPEQARLEITEELDRGGSLREISEKPALLVERIFERNWSVQCSTPREQIVVFDRGLPDVVAVGLIDGVDIEAYVHRAVRFRFAKALLFERLSVPYDHTIYHSPKQMDAIAVACEQIYLALGTPVVRVPASRDSLDATLTLRRKLVEEEIGGVVSKGL